VLGIGWSYRQWNFDTDRTILGKCKQVDDIIWLNYLPRVGSAVPTIPKLIPAVHVINPLAFKVGAVVVHVGSSRKGIRCASTLATDLSTSVGAPLPHDASDE